jgi:hypothetical protein
LRWSLPSSARAKETLIAKKAKGGERQVLKQPFHARVLLVNGWPRGARISKQQRESGALVGAGTKEKRAAEAAPIFNDARITGLGRS